MKTVIEYKYRPKTGKNDKLDENNSVVGSFKWVVGGCGRLISEVVAF
jgi:hypothetical protein